MAICSQLVVELIDLSHLGISSRVGLIINNRNQKLHREILLYEIESIRVHDLCPGRHKVRDKFLISIALCINLGISAQD